MTTKTKKISKSASKPARDWIVTSEGLYLVSFRKALAGLGTEGGAFSSDPRRARAYTRAEAYRVAAQIYWGHPSKAPIK